MNIRNRWRSRLPCSTIFLFSPVEEVFQRCLVHPASLFAVLSRSCELTAYWKTRALPFWFPEIAFLKGKLYWPTWVKPMFSSVRFGLDKLDTPLSGLSRLVNSFIVFVRTANRA